RQRDMELVDAVERLLARRRPRRDAHELELLVEPARVRDRAVALLDAFEVGLRLPAQQYAQRLILRRDALAIKLVVDHLADVRDVVAELPADRDQRRRHDEL